MADRPFEDLVILDSTQAGDLFLVSADRTVYAIKLETLIDTLVKGLGGRGFVIHPDDLALELDPDTDELYLTHKGVRCKKSVNLPTDDE